MKDIPFGLVNSQAYPNLFKSPTIPAFKFSTTFNRHFLSSMSRSAAEGQFSLLHSLIKARSFDDSTLRVLESLLVIRDVKSLVEVRSSLMKFLRSESLSIISSITDKSVEQKLLILQFFVRAFAVIGDVESCLALRYEALVLRELKSASCHWLEVSHTEWLNFVEDAMHNGFHSVAEKACENASSCFGKHDILESGADNSSENAKKIRKIVRLKERAMSSFASRSGSTETYNDFFMGVAHFKDVAMAHILAFENKRAEGRHLCLEAIRHWGDFVAKVAELYPEYNVAKLPKGTQPGLLRAKDAAKKLMDLGLEFTPMEEIIKDAVKSLKSKGYV